MNTVVITGGAKGMGLATAHIMGKDHRIVLWDIDQNALTAAVEELTAAGIDATGAVCDITDRATVNTEFDRAEAGGHVRAVVHSAGVSPQMGNAEFIFRVNSVGTLNMTESYLRLAREGDAMVNVSSVAGHMMPDVVNPKRTFALALTDSDAFSTKIVKAANLIPGKMRAGLAYGQSKAFVIWYSKKMAAAFGAKGARILSVSPGSFDTPMGNLEIASGSDKLTDIAALKRFGKPEEVGSLLAYVISEGPGYLTGVDIICDGGTMAAMTMKDMLAMTKGEGDDAAEAAGLPGGRLKRALSQAGRSKPGPGKPSRARAVTTPPPAPAQHLHRNLHREARM
ncbi:MAG: SDR family oxidoreductase [Cellulomonadaceae bacterium]|jgi:NAD(P)-dependent dehydrogenase (short-subunit alcohol dehydrogenase family)|nr:SDR family oxidoreductase [Cellulomonadaceae bacterium]